jgi:hypothetical protein
MIATISNERPSMIDMFTVPVLSFKQWRYFLHLLVPAEGNAPSLAHLGQAALVRR